MAVFTRRKKSSMESIKEAIIKHKIYLSLALILCLLVLIYYPTLDWLYKRYIENDSYYSHGFFVPFVALFLIYLKKEELKKIKLGYSIFGLGLVILSLVFHFLSMMAEIFFISGFSILFLIFGISLFLFGKKITKKIAFPLSFLFFMFPLPLVAINIITIPMKEFITKSVTFILNMFLNTPIKSKGFQIFFPKGTLIVENPCSGLRSLIVILALGSIFAYLLKASKAKKILLFLLAVPIAFISNMLRVLLLSFVMYFYGNRAIEGFLHDFTAYLVFATAFLGLWLFWRIFQCKDSV